MSFFNQFSPIIDDEEENDEENEILLFSNCQESGDVITNIKRKKSKKAKKIKKQKDKLCNKTH